MYSVFKLAKKYTKYYLSASNGKGHGIHSPFVFYFIKFILNDKKPYPCYREIESVRKQLLVNKKRIQVQDFGAGSSVIKTNTRIIGKIAASSLKPKKFAQLLYRMVAYYKPDTIVELGTSFGITSSYLAKGNENALLYTLEGSGEIANIAQQNFTTLRLKNTTLVQGDFAKTLPHLFSSLNNIDFAFIDGNHRKEPTLLYFKELLKLSNPNTILIFDDIHWSREMESAWEAIKQHDKVTLSIDLFFIGIIFLRKDFKVKQHFSIRF